MPSESSSPTSSTSSTWSTPGTLTYSESNTETFPTLTSTNTVTVPVPTSPIYSTGSTGAVTGTSPLPSSTCITGGYGDEICFPLETETPPPATGASSTDAVTGPTTLVTSPSTSSVAGYPTAIIYSSGEDSDDDAEDGLESRHDHSQKGKIVDRLRRGWRMI
ncbi:hypothetical protein F4821DRAFT_249243 [Hypoxylon rubiginosum]|uniref:Uncharacterized protein n=1 Tax=Hypoxylon rubiginosum TaxID=110542 RepID=A0ACC0CMC6_9PEZI|nr:hypothetical protein F4821DRAFT_249243 [Hypoxylon rubiginosum]